MNIEKYPTLNEALASLPQYYKSSLTKDDYLKHLGLGALIGGVIGVVFTKGLDYHFNYSSPIKLYLLESALFSVAGMFFGSISMVASELGKKSEIEVICRESETSEVLLKYTFMQTLKDNFDDNPEYPYNSYPYKYKYTLANIEELTTEDLSDNLEA